MGAVVCPAAAAGTNPTAAGTCLFILCWKQLSLQLAGIETIQRKMGVVSIAEHNVQELIVAADMLQLTEVVELCCEFLKGQIDPLNCIGLFQFSEQIACHDLMEFTESYIHAHFLEVQSGEEFLALTKEQLVKILRSEDLSIEDEYQVFTAAMQWILKDVGKRKKYVVEVLEPVRFPLLPAQRLLKYIESK